MNIRCIVKDVKEFVESLKESNFVYCPEAFKNCPYPVFCVNHSFEIIYQNTESRIYKELPIEVTQDLGIKTIHFSNPNSKQKEWAVTFTQKDWILIILIPSQLGIKNFPEWKNFTTKPLHGTKQLLQKIETVRTNLGQIQNKISNFKKITNISIMFQQYLMEETHVI